MWGTYRDLGTFESHNIHVRILALHLLIQKRRPGGCDRFERHARNAALARQRLRE
ncbi:MAG: hypothetical protein MZV64_35650 [Ignavibacteriales bacterium]|nr:hypothetical protein [Ignavibacteriales bacterium]